jgi:tetratricopeptide (TPR) repeat protein
MSEMRDVVMAPSPATAGEIAVINLESTRQHAWSRFWSTPQRPGLAEYIVGQEGLALAFLGDPGALDRLGVLAQCFAQIEGDSVRALLVQAQVASATHRFANARRYLAQAQRQGAPVATVNRLSLTIDQACGTRLDAALVARRQAAAQTRSLDDQVPLGALLADLREFEEADEVYRDALRGYQDVSPFAMAWVCFQLGVLWGELVSDRQLPRAEQWYRQAVAYLPSYVKARVHLAEIYLAAGRPRDAEALLMPALSSGDPEVYWRLGDAMIALGEAAEGSEQIQAARAGFEDLLERHLLAFADHGAEFYAGSGDNAGRAYELASVNLSNRPTLRAFEQAYATALDAGKSQAGSEILTTAAKYWGETTAFQRSPLAAFYSHGVENEGRS